jgi:hypothetical protein
VGRTGAELVLRLRAEGLQVPFDPAAGVYRVLDPGGTVRLVLGSDGPTHSAVVFAALAAVNRWASPVPRPGIRLLPGERQPTGGTLYAAVANDIPIGIGVGPSEAAAVRDLARIREAVGN